MAKKLNMPAPKAGGSGGFTDRLVLQAGKNVIRVYPITHGDDSFLAVPNVVVHFENGNGKPIPCLGKDCPMCHEAAKTKDRKLRNVTRYPMAVFAIEPEHDGEKRVVKYDAPSSVYAAIYSLVTENGEEILGNEGLDIIINYDKKKQGTEMYKVTLKAKGCAELDIADGEIPDLVAEWENDKGAGGVTVEEEPEVADADGGDVVFKTARGVEMEGTFTGVMQGGKYVIEADGQTYTVPADRIVSGIEVESADEDEEQEEEEEKPAPKAKKPEAKATKKTKAPAYKVGGEYAYDDEGEWITVTIVEIDEDAGTATVSCNEYEDFDTDLSSLVAE